MPGVLDLRPRPHQPLLHRRLGDQERPGDLGRRQPAQRPQGERHPRRHRQGRVAAGEDQPQPLVGDVLGVDRRDLVARVGVGQVELRALGGTTPHPVAGPVARHGGQPGERRVRHPVALPRDDRRGVRLLGALLGQVPVAAPADQARDEPPPALVEAEGDRVVGSGRHSQSGRSSITPPSATGCPAATCEGVVEVVALQQVVARDLLLGLGERPVGGDHLAVHAAYGHGLVGNSSGQPYRRRGPASSIQASTSSGPSSTSSRRRRGPLVSGGRQAAAIARRMSAHTSIR